MYMIFWILQRIIISLVLILCAHYIYIFLKTNLTTPKTRDLVNLPREKYKEMYEKINKNIYPSDSHIKGNGDNRDDGSNINNASQSKMKNELKNYLKDLKKSNNNNSALNNSISTSKNAISDGSSSFASSFSDPGFSTY